MLRLGEFNMVPVGTAETYVAGNAATALVSIPAEAKAAHITVDTNSLRYTVDGTTTPTSSVGHLAPTAKDIYLYSVAAMRKFSAIRATGSDASCHVTYYA